MNLIRKIDNYFLCDEAAGESAPLSDKIFYYGTLIFLLIYAAIFTYKLITF